MAKFTKLGKLAQCRYEFGCNIIDGKGCDEFTTKRIKEVLYDTLVKADQFNVKHRFAASINHVADRDRKIEKPDALADEIFSPSIEEVVKILGK